MKPSARPSIRLALAAFCALVWVWALPFSAHAAFHFDPAEYLYKTFTYLWTTTGTIEVQRDGSTVETKSFELSSPIVVTFLEETTAGYLPFELTISSLRARGIEGADQAAGGPITLKGRLDARGTLAEIESPAFLAEIGLDMADLMLGLVVPAPERGRTASPGTAWQSAVSRSSPVPALTRPLDLRLTYTAGQEVDWGNRVLQSVTARIRGDAAVREGSLRTEILEIGHGLIYVQPATGIVDLSSVSVILQIESRPPSARAVTSGTKVTLTTTITLQQVRSAQVAAEGAESAPQPAEAPAPALEAEIEQTAEPGEERPGEEEAAEGEPEAAPAEEAPEGTVVSAVYVDPAGRFELGLGPQWIPEPSSIGLRVTSFVSRDGLEHVYVYVMPLPSPSATALSIARSALTTYSETQPGFRVLVEPEPDELDGAAAYRAKYAYTKDGLPVTEWALFARMADRAFYLQYAYEGEDAGDPQAGLATLHALRDAFRFGPDPAGTVPVETLKESLITYTDPLGRFSLKVPSVWPVTEETPDASSVVFTELGENGYLTILAEPGARGISAAEIVSAWKEQWSTEPGFQVLVDVSPAPLGSVDGVRFDYTWSGGASGDWSRRLHAAVVDDLFVAVAFDYAASGFAERSPVFDEIVQSFTLLEPLEAPAAPKEASAPGSDGGGAGPEPPEAPAEEALAEEAPVEEAPAGAPAEDAAAAPGPEEPHAPGGEPAPAVLTYPFAEPEGEDTVILLGRVLTRYPGPTGAMVEEWAGGLEVTVIAGQDEFKGVTDELGYLYVANLPPLAEGKLYTIARFDGPMLGFTEPVSVTFDNLRVGQIGPRVAHLRTLILTLHSDRTLSVELVRFAPSAPDEPSALAHFVTAFPHSGWTSYIQEVIRAGID